MNGTFMFGEDRFGPEENFAFTYAGLGGCLDSKQVEEIIRLCYNSMALDYENPLKYDDFPQVREVLERVTPNLSAKHLQEIELVVALHELGTVPPPFADALKRLSHRRRLGLVSNLWSRKELWLQELDRAGLLDIFEGLYFLLTSGASSPRLRCLRWLWRRLRLIVFSVRKYCL
ncbi:hypothetical protein [Gloeobacter violaceus]|nr:hypothetical protein [Gloeobacter violaceus]